MTTFDRCRPLALLLSAGFALSASAAPPPAGAPLSISDAIAIAR